MVFFPLADLYDPPLICLEIRSRIRRGLGGHAQKPNHQTGGGADNDKQIFLHADRPPERENHCF